MKEPRRWLEDSSPELLEIRRLLATAETPRPMDPNERLQAAQRIEALEMRTSLPVHRFFPDFSLVTQWLTGSSDSFRPLGRAKRRARMFVIAVAILIMAAFAAAAPGVSDWWLPFVSHESAESEAKSPRKNPKVSPKMGIPKKPSAPAVVHPEPSSSSPLFAPVPIVTTSRKSIAEVPIAPVEQVPDEPAVLPSASPPEPVASQSQNHPSRLAAELALIDEARALVETNPSGALELLARHEREFPTGPTSFTRELLYVEALRKTGRLSEARIRAKGNLEWARGRASEGKWQQVLDSLQ